MKLSMDIENERIKYSYQVGETTETGECPLCPASLELFSDVVKAMPFLVLNLKKPKNGTR